MDVRTLSAGDEDSLERYLAPHAASSMFLRANAAAAGLVDRGAPLQGTYVGALEAGRIVGVAAHFWNGMLVLQAPEARALEPVARAALARSRRELRGIAGPFRQVETARRTLGLSDRATALDSREDLYRLDLPELRVPRALESGRLVCRRPREEELELLSRWRVDYSIETLGASADPELKATSRAEIERLQAARSHWVLAERGVPVSYSAFNARLPDAVQVGGVWTPPDRRSRGFGRAVVAGSLLEARSEGASLAVLFTDEKNVAARRAYESLGFRIVGDYGLLMLR